MAWFRNYYQCHRCNVKWKGEWSCMVDEECPSCGAKGLAPYEADELSFLIIEQSDGYAVLRSPETAEHTPDYVEITSFPTRDLAEAYLIEVEE